MVTRLLRLQKQKKLKSTFKKTAKDQNEFLIFTYSIKLKIESRKGALTQTKKFERWWTKKFFPLMVDDVFSKEIAFSQKRLVYFVFRLCDVCMLKVCFKPQKVCFLCNIQKKSDPSLFNTKPQ